MQPINANDLQARFSDMAVFDVRGELECLGLENVYWLEDGIEVWKEQGFETDVA